MPSDSVMRRLCGAWGPTDHPALPKDWPMPPCCNLDYEHDGPHRGSFGTEWGAPPNDWRTMTPDVTPDADYEALVALALSARAMVEDGHPDSPEWFGIMAARVNAVDFPCEGTGWWADFGICRRCGAHVETKDSMAVRHTAPNDGSKGQGQAGYGTAGCG